MTSRLTVQIGTYNVMAPVAEPLRFYGQTERMQRIPAAISQQLQVDILAVQESIIPEQHQILSQGFYEEGFIYQTAPLQTLVDGRLVSGGIFIMSKYPFIKESTWAFRTGCTGADCFATKGVVYAEVLYQGYPVHVFATHFQAWETETTQAIRHDQVQELSDFISETVGTSCQEPLIILGDFNMDLFTQKRQWTHLTQVLAAELPRRHPASLLFSSDARSNMLVGLDGDEEYQSQYYPQGCKEYLLQKGSCVCCPIEVLDYILVDKRSVFLSPESWYQIVPLHAEKPFLMPLTFTQKRFTQDLSDHYPVQAQLVFQVNPARRLGEDTTVLPPMIPYKFDDRLTRLQAFLICLTGVVAVLLLTWVCSYFDKRPE